MFVYVIIKTVKEANNTYKGENNMKNYGANKATEYSRKQIGVIFAKAKNGELKIEKWVISDLYNSADYYGFDDNGAMADYEQRVKQIIEAVFANEIEEAQELIDALTERELKLMGNKRKARLDRNICK